MDTGTRTGRGKIEVTVVAIDGDNLVLETVPQKNLIRWPLKNIPGRLEIGARLMLELQQNNLVIENTAAALSENGNDKEEQMRQLLEKLVN